MGKTYVTCILGSYKFTIGDFPMSSAGNGLGCIEDCRNTSLTHYGFIFLSAIFFNSYTLLTLPEIWCERFNLKLTEKYELCL